MLVRDVVRSYPEIRGYILLNEGFSYVGWPRAKASVAYQRNWIENWTKAIAVVAEECHKINPAIEVFGAGLRGGLPAGAGGKSKTRNM